MATRINTKFALGLFLVAALGGGIGGGLWWWKEHNTAAAREARGDREAARGLALANAGQADAADTAYIEACNQYALSLKQDIDNPRVLDKFKKLTIQLVTPTYNDAWGWAKQHLIACRHIAFISKDPRALGDFYAHILRLADETGELDLCHQLYKTADDDFRAYPGHLVSQRYRGVTALHLLAAPNAPWGGKEKRQLLALAKTDLETAHGADPTEPVGAGHLALLRMYEIAAMPEGQRSGPKALALANDAQKILDEAQSAHPDDLPLAVMAARVGVIGAQISHRSAAAAVRRAADLARHRPADLAPLDLQLLCHLTCTTLTQPAQPNPRLPGHTEGQQLALDMARHAVAGPGAKATLPLLSLGTSQSFAGHYADAIATFELALASGQRLQVADRMVFEGHRPDLLYLLAHNQINLAFGKTGPDRARLIQEARATADRVHAYPRMAARALVLDAQALQLDGHFEEAAGTFDRALRQDPALASPMLLHAAAYCHARCGNLGSAAELLKAGLAFDNARPEDHQLLAMVLLQMGAPEQAIAPHLAAAHSLSATALAGDLALRGGRFEEASEIFGSLDPLAVLAKRAAALRAMGRGETARNEAMALLREAPASAKRVYVVCAALEPNERPAALREAQLAGLPPADAKRVREALAKAAPPANGLGEDETTLAPDPDPTVAAALAAWQKQDWAGFEKAAKACPNHPDILGHRIELAVLRRDWAGARQLIERTQNQNIELPLGSGPVLAASVTAMQALESGQADLSKTADDLRAAAQDAPAAVGIWDLLTSVLLAANRPTEAIKSAEYACRLQPHRADRLRMLLQCRLRAGGFASEAIADLRKRSEQFPFNDNLRELWLTTEEALGDSQTAAAARFRRQETAPGDFVNAIRLAGILTRTGRRPEARTLLLKMTPHISGTAQNAPEAANQLAGALARAGFADDARLVLRQSLQSIPGFPPAQAAFMLALLETQLGDPVAEAKAWQAALNQEPRDSRPVSRAYANRLTTTGRLPEAIAFLRDLAGKIPAASPLHLAIEDSLANTLGMAGQYDQVTVTAKQLPEIEALVLRTNIALSTQDDAQALTLARQAADLAPKQASVWVLLGQTLACDPLREPEARQAVQRALALDPANPEARQLEASLDAQTGHYRVAINRLWRNLALNPDHAPSLALLTELLLRERDTAGTEALSLSGLQRKPDDLNYLRVAARSQLQHWRELLATGHPSRQAPAANLATSFQAQVYRQTEGPLDMAALVAILIETHRPDQALKMLDHLSGSSQKLPPLLAIRALALHKDNRAKEAQAAFAEAFRACADGNAVAECLRQAGKAYGAKDALRFARQTFGQKPAAFARVGMGLFAMQTNLPREALDDLTPLLTAPNLDPGTLTLVHGTLGVANDRLGRDPEAVRHYRLAVANHHQDLVSLNNLADILLRHPQLARDENEPLEVARRASFAAARAASAAAIPLRELAATRDTLGLACERSGNRKEALRIYNGVLEVFPLPESHLHLGLLLEADHPDAARAHYTAAAKLADRFGQRRLAAEARWHLDPDSFNTNAQYADLLADSAPEDARPLAEKCLKLARQIPPSPTELALFMRVCAKVWPVPGTDGRPQGLHQAADLAAELAADPAARGEYLLLSAVARECLGDPAWESTLDQALTRLAAANPAPWTPRPPRSLPLPDIATHAAVHRLPPSLWFVPRDALQDAQGLLLQAPESRPVRRLLEVLDAQLKNEHAQALKLLADQPPLPIVQRLTAASLAATGQMEPAAGLWAKLADSPQGRPADRIRLLDLLRRLKRPAAEIQSAAEAALKQDPACTPAKEVLGDLRLAAGDDAAAVALYAGLPPRQAPAAAVNAAAALRRLGQSRDADEMLQNRFADNPTDPWLFEALLRSEPDPKKRQAYFIQTIDAGLNPDLVYAFEQQWHLQVPGVEIFKKNPPPAPAGTAAPAPAPETANPPPPAPAP